MAKTRKTVSEDAVNVSLTPFETVYCNPMLLVGRMQSEALRATLERQVEMVDFLRLRIEKDMRLAERLLQAREPGEVVSACTEFCSEAVEDYAREAFRNANLVPEVTSEAVEQVAREAEEISDELKAAALVVA
ncbi:MULTISPECIES: hypothetical protein [unclassified Stappia]|uniref:hypothetical protein n=1 Tax=unclassified Stappia TaxID=2629676 RepID=UPI001643B775|nr:MULTISPECIES: hypothetical protein [unclassified Stappia]